MVASMEMPTATPTVTRELDVDADAHDVWEALVTDGERAGWLGGPTELDVVPGGRGFVTDPDGTRRDVLVDEVVPGRRLTLDWWTETGVPSHVEFEISPTREGSRLTVTERPLLPVARAADTAGPAAFALAGHLRARCGV